MSLKKKFFKTRVDKSGNRSVERSNEATHLLFTMNYFVCVRKYAARLALMCKGQQAKFLLHPHNI